MILSFIVGTKKKGRMRHRAQCTPWARPNSLWGTEYDSGMMMSVSCIADTSKSLDTPAFGYRPVFPQIACIELHCDRTTSTVLNIRNVFPQTPSGRV